MAEEHPHEEHARSEEDVIRTPVIVAVGVAALVLFFLASLAATAYLRVKVGERPVLPIPPEIGESKIGLVEQDFFGLAFRGERERAAQLQHLEAYGWVDRSRGIVHLPIDRAMELVVKGERARSGGAPAAGAPTTPEGQP